MVPVYDDCAEVRRKIRLLEKTPGFVVRIRGPLGARKDPSSRSPEGPMAEGDRQRQQQLIRPLQ